MLQADPIPETDDGEDTRGRIMKAAAAIFAESGYRYTTVRAICGRAGVNVAAVNYHFGGKKKLYLAVLTGLRGDVFAEHPFDLTDTSTGSPEDRLRGFIRTFISRVLDEGKGSRFAKIMAGEMIQPTDAFDEIIEEVINPVFSFLSTTVRQLFARPVTEEKMGLCCLSIVGQIFYFYTTRHVIRKLLGRERFGGEDIECFADHVTRFSLYAIDRMAREHEGETK